MNIRTCIKRGLFLILAVGFLLAGKELTVKAADKVPLTADVFKDENLLKAIDRYDSDEDGYLDKNEIQSINSLYVDESVADISGLDRLTSLNSVTLVYEGTSIKFGKKVTDVNLRMNASSICVDAPGAKYITVLAYWTSYYDSEMDSVVTKEASCETIDVSKCSNLRSLCLWANGMSSFKLPKNGGNLEELKISGSNIKTLKIPVVKKLTYLSVYDNEKLTSVDTQNAPNLRTLKLFNDPKLKSFPLNKNKKLSKLICGNTDIGKLDVSGNTNLEFLSCPNNNLTTLDCSKNVKLTAVQCYQNKLTTLNVKKATRLEEVSCEENKIKSLDLSQNSQLKTVSCYGNPIKNLYIKGKTNVLSKVSITPVILSAKVKDHTLEVNLKKNSKIKDYSVVAIPEGESYSYIAKKNGSTTYNFGYLSEGTYSVKAASGVQYKDIIVYAKAATYTEKMTVKSSW